MRHERLVREIPGEKSLLAGFAWIAGPCALIGACMVLFHTDDDKEREAASLAASNLVA